MTPPWRRVRPGWYLLAAAILYAVLMTVVAARQGSELREYRQSEPVMEAREQPPTQPERTESGLWFPLPGAELPDNAAHLPNSPRTYRQGVSQGFDFYDGGSGVPVPYGAAVIAAASGIVVRADHDFLEAGEDEWRRLMASVAEGADEEQLDRLRGRQVWLETNDGLLLRYSHLSRIRSSLREGQTVGRGEVLGFVGNSGTDEGVAGTRRGSRLHFQVWKDGSFFGEGMEPDDVRIAAASLFVGP